MEKRQSQEVKLDYIEEGPPKLSQGKEKEQTKMIEEFKDILVTRSEELE